MGGGDNFEDFTNSENPVFGLRLADNADKGIPLVNMISFLKSRYNFSAELYDNDCTISDLTDVVLF